MIKRITFLFILFLSFEKSFSQYIQQTRVLASSPSMHYYDWTVGRSYSFDEHGRAYYAINYRNCCLAFPPFAEYNRYDFTLNQLKTKSEDGDWHYTFPGHYNAFYGLNSHYNALRKIIPGAIGWTASPPLNLNKFKYIEEDYFQNVYYLNSDSIAKFDSTGTLLWKKSGGGNLVKADLSGNYYISTGSNILKYDPDGNLIRSMPYYGISHFVISKDCYLYLASSAITKLDSAGNVVYQSPHSASNLAVDKNGNVYFIGSSVSKLDSTGTTILWTSPGGGLAIGVDSLFNCYTLGTTSSGFVAPDHLLQYNTIASNSYYLYITKISSQPTPSDTVTTWPVSPTLHRICVGDSINIHVSFFMHHSLVPFKVQLSDSTGSFSSPLLLGTGSSAYFKVFIPASVPPGNGYRIRVRTTTGSPILIPNTDGPFRIGNTTSQIVSAINANFNGGSSYRGCAGTPAQLVCNTNVNFLYQWYYITSSPNGGVYNSIAGATDSIYSITSSNNHFNYAVHITDTAAGCGRMSATTIMIFDSPTPATIGNLPAAICLNQPPITLSGQPWGGAFSGDGMYGKIFYPDSAGVGAHAITYSYNNFGCGIIDTTVTVSVKSLPSSAITPNGSVSFCSGDSIILNAPANNNRTYQWKKGGNDIAGATVSNYTASIGGVYKVTVTNTISGCSKTTVPGTVVTVNPLPGATITPQGPTTFCAGGSVILSANTGAGLTYRWKKDGTSIPGATSENYTATTGGVYKVKELNSYGCSKLSTGVLVSVPCREGEELNESSVEISIFPNPAPGKFTIQSLIGKISQITITNVSGQTIYKREFPGSPPEVRGVEIDLTNQSKGVYMVQVIADKEVNNQKIILQ
ncbi:MAG TPA: T9SS type A sorting domain-containing protein [Bacteroidia bacterium]|nr:T9SS type A sorting domain-containing protein [Bacteroidia bacterium]